MATVLPGVEGHGLSETLILFAEVHIGLVERVELFEVGHVGQSLLPSLLPHLV